MISAVVVVILSSQMVALFYRNDVRESTIVWLKMAYVFLQVPISNALFILFVGEQILAQFFELPKKGVQGDYDVGDVTAKG
jgi:hypothetical protein